MDSPLDVGDDIARTMASASRAVKTGIRAAMRDVGDVARDEFGRNAQVAAGADKRFRNAGSLGVRFRYDDSGVTVIPKGSWGLAEEGARPHTMPAWGRGTAHHPGTQRRQGRRLWTSGREAVVDRATRVVPEVVGTEVGREMDRG